MAKRKVFISWSGKRSERVASALRDWLPLVMNNLDPWVSTEDIRAGARWLAEIGTQLATTKAGILCLTRENTDAPWLIFEAGALAKTLDDDTLVCPYLIDMAPHEIPTGSPLLQFQAKRADADGTWSLVKAVNQALEEPLPESHLRLAFDAFSDRLLAALKETEADAAPSDTPPPAPTAELAALEEIVQTVREVSRRITRVEEQVRRTHLSLVSPQNVLGGLAAGLGKPDLTGQALDFLLQADEASRDLPPPPTPAVGENAREREQEPSPAPRRQRKRTTTPGNE